MPVSFFIMSKRNLKKHKIKIKKERNIHLEEQYCSRLLRALMMMDNLALSTFIFLVSLSLFFAAPMQDSASSSTTASSRTEVEYLQDLKAGLQVLDAIAVSVNTNN